MVWSNLMSSVEESWLVQKVSPESRAKLWNRGDGQLHVAVRSLAVVVEPLPALAVGEEAVARSALGGALELGLEMEV